MALPLVSLGSVAAALSYGVALLPGPSPRWAAFALAGGIGLLLAGLLLLGARRHGRVSPGLGWVLVGTSAWVAGGLMVLLALPGVDAADAPLVLGLPRRAAFLLLGVGLAPGFVLPLAYARVFDEQTLSEEDLAELKAAADRVRRAREAGGGSAPPAGRRSGGAVPPPDGAETDS